MLPGDRVSILDGNCLEASEQRLEMLRELGFAPLPGKSRVICDPHLDLMIDPFPCQDEPAQERAFLGRLLAAFQAGEA